MSDPYSLLHGHISSPSKGLSLASGPSTRQLPTNPYFSPQKSAATMPPSPSFDDFSPPPEYKVAASTFSQAPSCPLPPTGDSDPHNAFHIPKISLEEAKSLVESHVRSKSCWGSKAAKELTIVSITMKASYHYHLDTFTEKRDAVWKFEPAVGFDPNSIPIAQSTVRPEDFPVPPSHLFTDGSQKLEVPHSSNVRRCEDCLAIGRINCPTCFGQGNGVCIHCSGIGQKADAGGQSARCFQCAGSGRSRCTPCNGSGKVTCNKCNGLGNLRWYMELTLTWKNHQEDFLSDSTGLKKKHIMRVTGIKTYQEESAALRPLANFPDKNVADASTSLVERQLKAHPNEKVIRQRHHVGVIPVAQVNYMWRGKTGSFFIYGSTDERNVYFKRYPQRFCYGLCSIA